MKLLFTSIFIFLNFIFLAQNSDRITDLISSKRTLVNKISSIENSTTTLISSDFSDEMLRNKVLNLEELTIVKIYYVYTEYKLNPNFDQLVLDRKRFIELDKNYPGLINNPFIEWELIEQTGCTDFKNGTSFFHGFILVHRPSTNSEDRKEEIKKLMAFLENPVDTFSAQKLDFIEEQLPPRTDINKPTVLVPDEVAKFKDGEFALYQYFQNEIYSPEINTKRDDFWVEVNFEIDELGRVGIINFSDSLHPKYIEDNVSQAIRNMPEWNAAKKSGESMKSKVNLKIRVSYSRSVNGMYLRDGVKPSFIGDEKRIGVIDTKTQQEQTEFSVNTIKISGVYKGLDLVGKNEKLAMVVDVTGSMSPHIVSLKKWIQLNPDSLQFTSYSFFNDGDGKATVQKKKGKTGGIYMTKDVKQTTATIETAMLAGSGGEISESDMEAVLFAIENDSLCDAILLVADNFSDVRDISLLKEVSKKVNVLLCEAPQALRTEYLKIVKETGGYLLLNGKKIELKDLQKGDEIILQDNAYLFDGNDFKMRKKD